MKSVEKHINNSDLVGRELGVTAAPPGTRFQVIHFVTYFLINFQPKGVFESRYPLLPNSFKLSLLSYLHN